MLAVFKASNVDIPYIFCNPVCAFMPQHFFSVSVDGKIKAWEYKTFVAQSNFEAPGIGHTKMAYSADNKRL